MTNAQDFARLAEFGLAWLEQTKGGTPCRKGRKPEMPSTKRYRLLVSWSHRKWGPQTMKLAAEGSSIRRALNSALLGFFSDKNSRPQRLDAHAHLRVEIWRLARV
jgi:hypothetical protein